MSYSYHRARAEKNVSSRNFITLVDAAVMLHEEEHGQGKSECHTKTTKSPSEKEEEEERDKRIFRLFPRKARSVLKNSVEEGNPQQKPLQLPSSSSSSRLLLDLNMIPADDSGTETPGNPNRPSCSSSFLGDYKIPAESEKMTTEARNPRNPNPQSSLSSCLTEKTSRKRRAAQESKVSGKSKKAKVEAFSWKGRETPEWLNELMETMGGTELKLIFERNLFRTDVNPSESRLSMPFNELIRNDFLTLEEWRLIEKDINKKKKTGLDAILVDQRNERWSVKLKRWEGKNSWSYALNSGWNDVVEANGLKEGHDISIWSFRSEGLLCFALVTPPSMAQSSSSSLAICL